MKKKDVREGDSAISIFASSTPSTDRNPQGEPGHFVITEMVGERADHFRYFSRVVGAISSTRTSASSGGKEGSWSTDEGIVAVFRRMDPERGLQTPDKIVSCGFFADRSVIAMTCSFFP